MKEKRILCCICAACLSTLLFCGCESWKRTPSPDAPKEVQVSAPADAVEEEEDFEAPNEESEEDIEQENVDENSFLAQSASIVSRTDESVRWETQDEMLSQKLYDLLNHQNEAFSEKFDEREYDYLATITSSQGEEQKLYLWINFQRENEIIVEDENGTQWNISVEDSNQVRSMASSLISG